jgi:radical SAM protein with 4Fe4S-binding SPASM domain
MTYQLARCVWEITLACCFSCRYCGSRAGKARENELSTEECFRVADELADLGCARVSLIGGEVFMRRDWKEIVLRLTRRGIAVNLITNGALFHEQLLQDLKTAGIESVSVSIDGPRDIHDAYRQAGSFDRAVGAVSALTAAGIPTSIITTLHSENAPHLEELLTAIRQYPIFAWQIQACSPMGSASESGLDHRFDFRRVMAFIDQYADTVPFSIGMADNIGYFSEADGRLRGNRSGKAFFRGCLAGISAIGIDSAGNVRGCESMYDARFIEGNVREQSLKSIWEDPENFAYNRKFSKELLTGACAECAFGEYCAGGCRSYNYFVHGKLYESPYCIRNQEH